MSLLYISFKILKIPHIGSFLSRKTLSPHVRGSILELWFNNYIHYFLDN